MITATEVRARADVRPFLPFRVVTSSGQSYEVRHPELLWVSRREVVVARPASPDAKLIDGMDRIAMLHITALEDLPVSMPPHNNGTSA